MKEELESQGELRVNQEVFPPTPSESEPVDALEALIAEFANCVKAYQDGFYLQDEQLVAAARAERAKLVESLKKISVHVINPEPAEDIPSLMRASIKLINEMREMASEALQSITGKGRV